MLLFIRHPLFVLVAGALFTAGLTRRWQKRQKELETRSQLVSDIADCVMGFDVPLRRVRWVIHSGAIADLIRATDGELSADLESCRMEFDVKRCVLHTKLETYFPLHPWIEEDWTTMATCLLSLSNCVTQPLVEGFSEADRDRLGGLRLDRDAREKAARKAQTRAKEVGEKWAHIEELLLAEKVRLIAAVRKESMRVPSDHHKGTNNEVPSVERTS